MSERFRGLQERIIENMLEQDRPVDPLAFKYVPPNMYFDGGDSETSSIVGLEQLDKQYGQLFKDLTIQNECQTELEVISCIVTYDS